MKFHKVPWFEGPDGNVLYESLVESVGEAIQQLPELEKKSGGVRELSMRKTDIARKLLPLMTRLGKALGLPGVPKTSVRMRYQEGHYYAKLHWDAKHLDRTDPNSGTYYFRVCLRLPIARDTEQAHDRKRPNYLLLGESEVTEPKLYYIKFDSGFWVSEDQREDGRTAKAASVKGVVMCMCMAVGTYALVAHVVCCGCSGQWPVANHSAACFDQIPWRA